MSPSGDDSSPKESGLGKDSSVPDTKLESEGLNFAVPKVPGHQDVVDALWPLLMKDVEGRMVQMEQELIKRHNIKMMNEMQEVVRQIKQAKTKNDEILKDYHRKQTDLTRSVLEIAEKFAAMRADIDEIKRQSVINKQQLSHRCDQTTEQVTQLKQAVFAAWQREKSEIQQTISQNFRGDMALVLNQFDNKLRENVSEVSKLRYEVGRVTAILNGEDPESVKLELPVYTETSLPSGGGSLSSSPEEPATTAPQTSPQLNPGGDVDLTSLTQNLAAFIARHQTKTGASGPPTVNLQMLQQFMQTLPRQQQLQLQGLLQKHRAAAATAPGVGSPQVAAKAAPAPAPAVAPTPAAPAAPVATTMIQSLAQQLHFQVNQAQQKATSSAPNTVNCPYFSMFGWCKFGDRCRYLHAPSGKEPLRNLPQSVIQTLQNQLASGSTELTTQTLMSALAGVAARQAAPAAQPPPPGLTAPAAAPANSIQQAMIQAQIQAQQEAAQMGLAKAKLIPCKFFAIGRCAYGDRCAYSHGTVASDSTAAAAAAAWGKTGLQQASWGVDGGATLMGTKEETATGAEIVDGEDDTSYDQWNALTFDTSEGPPPGL